MPIITMRSSMEDPHHWSENNGDGRCSICVVVILLCLLASFAVSAWAVYQLVGFILSFF